MRTLSIVAASPLAVVLNTNLPGILLEPGVPSIKACILALSKNSDPSDP